MTFLAAKIIPGDLQCNRKNHNNVYGHYHSTCFFLLKERGLLNKICLACIRNGKAYEHLLLAYIFPWLIFVVVLPMVYIHVSFN